MFLDYAKNHAGGKYRMLNLRGKRILLSCDVTWIKKTYGEQISRKKTQADTFIQLDEDESYNWAHVKIDPVKNEVRTKNIKTEENVDTEQDSRGRGDEQKNIKIISFTKQ